MLIRILQLIIILITIAAINSVSGLVKADIYKKEGKESLKKNFPYLAVDKFSKALKLDNSDGEARGYLGMSYINLAGKTNNFKEKENQFKKAIYEIKDSRKTYETPSINYNLAEAYELSGDIDSAIEESVKSYGQIPSGETRDKLIFLYKKKGDMFLSQNKKEEAIKYYSKTVEVKGVNVTKEDITDYEFLRNLMPDNFFVHYCLAKLYMEQNLWDKAVIELEYIRKIGISNEDIMGRLMYTYYNLGSKYSNEKKFKEAERYLSYILILDTMNRFGQTFNAIYNLSSIYEQTGDINKAVETLMKLEGIDTQKGQGYYQIGHLYNRKSNPQKAIEYYEKYLPYCHISDVSIFSILGILYEQAGDIDKAVEIYSKLEGINYSKGQGHYYNGLLYAKKERWTDALKEFEYALKISPKDSKLLVKIGELYEKTGNNVKALEIYKKVIAIDPTKAIEANFSMSRIYEKLGEKEKAISYFNESRNILNKNILKERTSYD